MRRTLYDIAALVARLLIGSVFIAHGLQKAGDLGGTTSGFGEIGVPFPDVAGPATMLAEIGAGALLIAGLLTPAAGVLLALVAAGAAFFVHWNRGVFVTEGGWELVAALGSAALLLAAGGAGRFSLDYLFVGRRRELSRRAAGLPYRGEGDLTDTRPFGTPMDLPRHRREDGGEDR